MTWDSLISLPSDATQVLVVLALPAVAAILCFLCGNADRGRLARRTAVWMSLILVGLTGILAASLQTNLDPATRTLKRNRFAPIAVPGDPTESRARNASPRDLSSGTTWTLIPVGAVRALAREGEAEKRVPHSDIQFYVGIDGLNLWLLPLTAIIGLAAVALTWKNGQDNPGSFLGWLFLLQFGAIGAFLSFDVVLFFAFFEITLVPALFLIGRYGVGGTKREAARTFFLYTLLGGSLTLVGLLGTVGLNPIPLTAKGSEFLITDDNLGSPKPQAGPITFSIPQLMHNSRVWDLYAAREKAAAIAQRRLADLAVSTAKSPAEREFAEKSLAAAEEGIRLAERRTAYQMWLFFALMAGFAVKLPIVPFHGWLPAAYSEAPAGITMFLSAILAKLGAFGILRVAIPLHMNAANDHGLSVFGTLAAFGVVYAALCAFAQTDLKRLAAYSSVSHLGLIVLGAFSMSSLGMGGAAFHMIAHGLSAGLMFGLLAFLADRFGSLDSNRFGGLMARYPRYSLLMMVAVLAGVGLPGLCNFVGEMGVIASLFDPRVTAKGYGLAAAACAGVFLSAWYSFTFVRKVFFGPERIPDTTDHQIPPDLDPREWSILTLLALGCLALGILPNFVIRTMEPEVQMLGRIAAETAVFADTDRIDAERIAWETIKNRPDRNVIPEEFQQKGIPIRPPQVAPPGQPNTPSKKN